MEPEINVHYPLFELYRCIGYLFALCNVNVYYGTGNLVQSDLTALFARHGGYRARKVRCDSGALYDDSCLDLGQKIQ